MTLQPMMIGVGGLSFAIFILGYMTPSIDKSDELPEIRPAIALSDAPFVLRDGRQAVVDVMKIPFEPKTASLSEEAQEPLQDLLDRKARGCVLSAQVVGAASELETAPQPVVDAHLLALERAGAIAAFVNNNGVPATALASLWTVDNGLQVPHSVLWVFSSSNESPCVPPTTSFETVEVPAGSATVTGTEQVMIVNLPMQRPHRERSTDVGQATANLPSAASASVGELVLTFADNSSYLDDQAIMRLRRFAGSLGSACTVILKATVAGGANAHYASWLAERRMARVADQLAELATIEGHVFVPDDARRQVVVTISDGPSCSVAQEMNSTMNSRL